MKKLQFSIEINASKESVWATLWDDTSFRDWANIIDEGTYMKGAMEEGKEIQFLSSVNGYGVTSLIAELDLNAFVLFRHSADTQGKWTTGTRKRVDRRHRKLYTYRKRGRHDVASQNRGPTRTGRNVQHQLVQSAGAY